MQVADLGVAEGDGARELRAFGLDADRRDRHCDGPASATASRPDELGEDGGSADDRRAVPDGRDRIVAQPRGHLGGEPVRAGGVVIADSNADRRSDARDLAHDLVLVGRPGDEGRCAESEHEGAEDQRLAFRDPQLDSMELSRHRARVTRATRWTALVALVLGVAGCETEEEALRTQGVKPLDAAALKSTFVGNTVYGTTELIGEPRIFYIVYYASDGTLRGKAGESFAAARKAKGSPAVDTGKWRITDDGKICNGWKQWVEGHEGCGLAYKVKNEYRGFTPKGAIALKYTVKPGNPDKL